ncbi:MAG: PAS domain-containing protein [Chloroflexi bacterium]|nr:PAS domain-containing protein [Chloroflexota bacterium]
MNGRSAFSVQRGHGVALPLILMAAGLWLLLSPDRAIGCSGPTFALLLLASAALSALPVRLPHARVLLALTPAVLLTGRLLCGPLAVGILALGGTAFAAALRAEQRLPPLWQCAASLLAVSLATMGSGLAALLATGNMTLDLLPGIVHASAFALGLWAGQLAVEAVYHGRRGLAPDVSSLLATLALMPAGIYLARISVSGDELVFGASLAASVALLILIRGFTNSDTRARDLEREASVTARAREELELIVDHAPEAIVALDRDGKIQWLNQTAAEWLGERAQGAIGTLASETVIVRPSASGERLNHVALLGRARASGKPVHEEGRLEMAPGAPRQVVASYSSAGDPARDSLGLVLLRDAALMTESLREQEEVAIHLSHELRAPLTTILGYAQLLAGPPSKKLGPDAQEEFVKRINESGDYMLRLVNNLLDLGRLERGAEPVPVARIMPMELTEQVSGGLRQQAQAKGQTLDVQQLGPDEPIETSELYLRQVLTNLIANAIKYTPTGGHVTVRVQTMPEDITWQVEDTGIGLSEEELPCLFTKFFRSARPEARLIKGTGLGLALTKELVERMGGTVSVQSELDVGSTFTVRLPRPPRTGRSPSR